MTTDSKKQTLKTIKERRYLNRDFDSFRSDLEDYARTYFGDKIKDFTPNSMGGLLLDLPAYIGDVTSFYLDFQFHETSPETAVEPRNIQRHLRDAGVKIYGATPAVVDVSFTIKVPVDTSGEVRIPLVAALPVIEQGTTLQSDAGVFFELTEDLDFSETDSGGILKANIVVADVDSDNNPITFFLTREGTCISGQRATESFSVGVNEQFKRYGLGKPNVSEVIRVRDDQGNEYYEVEHLTQDTVFKAILNKNEDNELVKDNLEIIPVPYRFTKETNVNTRSTTLVFGGGIAQTTNDDIIPDPSEYALPLYGKRTFSRFTLNPNNLLRTTTLGIITPNSTITVEYRYGGGLSHNVGRGTVRNLETLFLSFPGNPVAATATFVRQNITITNSKDAEGGDDAKTLDELKQIIPAEKNAQNRIVTKADLLARVYNMPSNFGRVFRAAIRSNPYNANAAQFFVLCRNQDNELTYAPDALKKNLSKYLNEFRLISDAIDILDAQIINLKLSYRIAVHPDYNKQQVLQNVNSQLNEYFSIKNFEIDQPISISDIHSIVYSVLGVVSVQNINFTNILGTDGDRSYSNNLFDVSSNTLKGLIIPPPGGIFELKYKSVDIIGQVI
jgi:hypothetical protein